MPHRILAWLEDIQTCMNRINTILGPRRNFFMYKEDVVTRLYIERNLEIIGEAMNRILKKNPDIPISHARNIVNLRNLITHAYDGVDNEEIWRIICNDLPLLKIEVDHLLEELENHEK